MLFVYISLILCLRFMGAQPTGEFSANDLDSMLQGYAFKACFQPTTGILHNEAVPANLTGIEVKALRLRSGSLRRKGFSRYKEFHIPVGVVVQPYVLRVVLVYHNLGNWSTIYYPLPGYGFLTPVLGILAYDAANLSATNLSEVDIRASGDPITIQFLGLLQSWPKSNMSSPKCAYFGLDGSVVFDAVVNRSTCLTTYQGHFSIVLESAVAPMPAPAPGSGNSNTVNGGRWRKVGIIFSSVVGGALLLVFFALTFACLKKCLAQKHIQGMEEAAESGVALPMTRIGDTKAPFALETRTRPFIENECLP